MTKLFTEDRIKNFKPTYLYIKTHNVTGLKYFGKTICKDPHKYKGSGTYWKSHCKVHGYDYFTEIIGYFTNFIECYQTAIYFSLINNIVESDEWANLCIEKLTGDGINIGKKLITNGIIAKYIEKDEIIPTGWKLGATDISNKKNKESHIGKKQKEETKQKISKGNLGKTFSNQAKKKMSETQKKLLRITNGQIEKVIRKDEPIPNGWRIGFSDTHKANGSKSRIGKKLSDESKYKMLLAKKGKKLITNGLLTKFIRKYEVLPEGWKYVRK